MGMQTVCFDVANLGRRCCEIGYYLERIDKVAECWAEPPVSAINPNYSLALAALAACGVIVTFAFVQRYFFASPLFNKAPAASYNNVDSLLISSKEGNVAHINKCLAAGVDANETGNGKKTALTEACKAGKWGAAKLLIEKGAVVDQCNGIARTALHFAAAANNADMVRFLLKHGADVSAQDAVGLTPLHLICKEANAKKEILELLFANTKVSSDKEGNTPLHLACKGNKDAAQFLINKVDLDAKNNEGQTPCHIAAKANRSDILEFLVSNKANPNLQDKEGNTPLHDTVLEGCAQAMITLLKAFKINPNILNERGESPLHISIYKLHGNADALALQLLAFNNVDVNLPINQQNTVKDEEKILQGMTPAHLAIHFGNKEILESLIKKEAKLDICDAQGNSPLLLSILNDKTVETEILIRNMDEKALQSPTKNGLSYAEHAATRFDERTLTLLAQKRILFTYFEKNKEQLILTTLKNFHRYIDSMLKKYPTVNIDQLNLSMDEISKAKALNNFSDGLAYFSEEIDYKLKYFAKFSEEAARGNKYSIRSLSFLLQTFQISQIDYAKPLVQRAQTLPMPPIPSRIMDAITQTNFSNLDDMFAILCKIGNVSLAAYQERLEHLRAFEAPRPLLI